MEWVISLLLVYAFGYCGWHTAKNFAACVRPTLLSGHFGLRLCFATVSTLCITFALLRELAGNADWFELFFIGSFLFVFSIGVMLFVCTVVEEWFDLFRGGPLHPIHAVIRQEEVALISELDPEADDAASDDETWGAESPAFDLETTAADPETSNRA